MLKSVGKPISTSLAEAGLYIIHIIRITGNRTKFLLAKRRIDVDPAVASTA